MATVWKLHEGVNRQLNRIDNSWGAHLSTIDIDGYLNQSKNLILENYNAIAEKNRTLSDRLRTLEIRYKELVGAGKNNIVYRFLLPEDHYSTLNISGVATVEGCKTEDDIFIHKTQSHKLNQSLRDSNWRPDFNWRETFCNEDASGVSVYHGKVLIVKKVYIDYLKNIPDVANVRDTVNNTYINADGKQILQDIHLGIDDPMVAQKIVDIAVSLIKRDFDDNYRGNLETILFNERVNIN